jgi:hypothetical protein
MPRPASSNRFIIMGWIRYTPKVQSARARIAPARLNSLPFMDRKKHTYTVEERLLEERRALKRKDSAISRFEIIEKTQMKLEVGHSPDFIEGLLMIEHLFKKRTGCVRRGFDKW